MSSVFKFGIGTVLYNPDIGKIFEIYNQEILNNCDIVFVDNHSDNIAEIEQLLTLLRSKNINISLINNNENKGIATALNQIMNFFSERAYEWVLLLDQDTIVEQNLLNTYEQRIRGGIEKSIAILSPVIFDRNIGDIIFKDNNNENVKKCITSGSLNRIEKWEQIGGFDEFFFIDWVDYDYCTRQLIAGNRIIIDGTIVLNHSIGDAEKHGRYNVMKHNAFRTYYICRNMCIYAYKFRHYGKEIKILSWLDARVKIMKLFIAIILYDEEKIRKIKSGVKGIIDYYKCRNRYLETLL